MMYIGRRTVPKLRRLGIHTIGDMARADIAEITRLLGKTGADLVKACRGLDDSPVIPAPPEAITGIFTAPAMAFVSPIS